MSAIFLLCFSYQAHSDVSCQHLFKGSTVSTRITLSSLKNAFLKIHEAFVGRLNSSNEADMIEPHNSFFRPEQGYESGQSWKSPMEELKVSRQELDASWNRPVCLSSTQMSLYKGHLFPTAYFVRRTSTGMGLSRFIPTNFQMFGDQMPFAILQGSSVETYPSGGAKKMFELWARDFSQGDGYATLYRGSSKTGLQLQVLVRHMLQKNLDASVSEAELSELKAIHRTANADSSGRTTSHLGEIIERSQLPLRRDLVAEITKMIGFFSGGIFMTTDFQAADMMKSPGGVTITYRIPLKTLRELLSTNEIYMGIEYNYLEFAFIDQPENQNAKHLLFNSIVDASP